MSNPSCYYPLHVFSCYITVRLCWTLSNYTEPTHQSPSIVIDHNHALTPIQCYVPVHMQCNAPLHVILCHIYHECYMNNSNHTIHHVLWTIISKVYNFQIKPISMSIYINTHISTFNYPKHVIQTQAMTTLINKTNRGMDMPIKQSTQWPQGKP